MARLYSSNTNYRAVETEDDVDPMATIANITDAMLVFACGLMVALVVAWNVDLKSVQEVDVTESQQVEDVQTLQDILSSEGSSYIERGTVYQDPRTGQMYLLEATGEE